MINRFVKRERKIIIRELREYHAIKNPAYFGLKRQRVNRRISFGGEKDCWPEVRTGCWIATIIGTTI